MPCFCLISILTWLRLKIGSQKKIHLIREKTTKIHPNLRLFWALIGPWLALLPLNSIGGVAESKEPTVGKGQGSEDVPDGLQGTGGHEKHPAFLWLSGVI